MCACVLLCSLHRICCTTFQSEIHKKIRRVFYSVLPSIDLPDLRLHSLYATASAVKCSQFGINRVPLLWVCVCAKCILSLPDFVIASIKKRETNREHPMLEWLHFAGPERDAFETNWPDNT